MWKLLVSAYSIIHINSKCSYTGRAFATVETIASRFAIQYKDLLELSAQQLISCDVKSGELNGCSGGTLLAAFWTVKEVSLNL